MAKMKELSTLLDELITCGETLTQTATALKEYFSGTSDEEPAKAEPKKKTPAKKKQEPEPEASTDDMPYEVISKEDVRKVLAEVSQSGHRSDVIALLKKYGADNITALKEEDYAAVIKEAEEIRNG